MISFRSFATCAAAIALFGCDPEATFVEPVPDYAAIHWLNAVPDTNQQDIRVIDIPSNAGLFDVNFRGSNMFYQPIEAGSRTVRVFLSHSHPDTARQILQESTLSLTTNAGYTFIHAGFARVGSTPARAVFVIPDAPAAPAADSVGLRFIHVGAGMGNLDINVIRRGSDTLPDAPLLANVAYGAVSGYSSVKTDSMRVFHPRTGVDSVVFYDTLRVVVTAAGTKTPRLVTAALPFGAPNTINTATAEPIAGAAIRGSVLTSVVVPPSVAGSKAPQAAAFLVPASVPFVDRRPAMLSPAP